jgi:hypothetical protein
MKSRIVFAKCFTAVFIFITANLGASSPYQQMVTDFVTPLYSLYKIDPNHQFSDQAFLVQYKPQWHWGVEVKVSPFRLQMYFFEFSDTITTEKAFIYLLKQLSNRAGATLEICSDIGSLKSPPVLYLVGYNSISILHQMCEEEQAKRNDFMNSFLNGLSFRHVRNLSIGCGGPVKWKCE